MSNVKSQRFVFMGSPQFAATILSGVLKAGWTPSLVITEPAKPVGRKQILTPTAVQTYAESIGLPVETPTTKQELLGVLLRLGARLDEQPVEKSSSSSSDGRFSTRLEQKSTLDLLVVAAYGRILTQAMLNVPRFGAINVHASLLPKYRGASPIQAALLARETQTGITFMAMEAGLDTGPIIAQVPVPIAPRETTVSLTQKLANVAAEQIGSVLESYTTSRSNKNNPTYLAAQDDSQATYAPKLTKADAVVELTTINPGTLDRMVRALNPWPGVVTTEFGAPLKVLEGSIKDSTYTITKLQWAGKSPVDGATFARAYPEILTQLPPSITLGRNM